MSAIVNQIKENSIAQEIGIEIGDEVLSIDDEQMTDLIEYNFLCKSEFLTLEVKKKNGEIELIELEKDYDDELGIIFESAVFDKIKPCANKCIFCFVDQQPDGLRETLYVKDDDYRLSYLQGTYITLTNLSHKDIKRLERLRLGPLYVSVHTTNPQLRVKMLRNPNAAKIMDQLKWLQKNEIPLHVQIVLCPKYNDGQELQKTLSDLKKLKNILSIAIVPVGITKFRDEGKDSELYPVTKEIAKETIKIVDDFNNSVEAQNHVHACCSDEFFALAEKPIPPDKYYGNFSQLDDGVGALRLLIDDFEQKKEKLPKKLNEPHKVLFATSQLAKPAIDVISKELNKIKDLTTKVLSVKSDYWGEGISVAGLITSDDLINTVKGTNADTVIIPSVMLRQFTQDFLDGKDLNFVKKKTKLNFLVIEDFYSTQEIIDFILSLK